ncbi:MAG: peptidylprolyl isomerase [Candidatus Woesearchaeota archaeon]
MAEQKEDQETGKEQDRPLPEQSAEPDKQAVQEKGSRQEEGPEKKEEPEGKPDSKEGQAEKKAGKEAKEKIKKGDFIEIDYIGQLKSDGTIFDTTDEGVARKEGFYNEDQQYGPAVICVGQHQIVKGIDSRLEGKETGTEYVLDIPPEEGFGKKDGKLIQLVPTSKFLKQNIQPQPGLQVNIDGSLATIKSVSGGRTLVDFNHPLSSQDIRYKIRPNRIVRDDKEKLKSLLNLQLNIQEKSIEGIDISDGKAVVRTKQKLNLPKEVIDAISKNAAELIPSIKGLEFTEGNKKE